MLSILIPIYNFDVVGFVKDLSNQASACNIEFKILCFDDGSITEFKSKNQELATLPNVVYTELPQNVGRSKIRNLLAEKAQFEYLLFLDCDSTTNNNQFVRNYIENLKSNTVVYGVEITQIKLLLLKKLILGGGMVLIERLFLQKSE